MSVYQARITDEWLPIPEAALIELGWREGDTIEIEVVDGQVILARVQPEDAPRK